jgi:hypothetical protein
MVPLARENEESYTWLGANRRAAGGQMSLAPDEVFARHPFISQSDSWERAAGHMPESFAEKAVWG